MRSLLREIANFRQEKVALAADAHARHLARVAPVAQRLDVDAEESARLRQGDDVGDGDRPNVRGQRLDRRSCAESLFHAVLLRGIVTNNVVDKVERVIWENLSRTPTCRKQVCGTMPRRKTLSEAVLEVLLVRHGPTKRERGRPRPPAFEDSPEWGTEDGPLKTSRRVAYAGANETYEALANDLNTRAKRWLRAALDRMPADRARVVLGRVLRRYPWLERGIELHARGERSFRAWRPFTRYAVREALRWWEDSPARQVYLKRLGDAASREATHAPRFTLVRDPDAPRAKDRWRTASGIRLFPTDSARPS